MKKIFLGAFVFLLLTIASVSAVPVVFAQPSGGDFSEETESVTQVFIDSVFVSTTDIQGGTTLQGSFAVHNVGATALANLRYRLELVQLIPLDDGGFVPSEALHVSAVSDPETIAPGVQTIPFTYTLPAKLPEGTLGLLVQAYEQDMMPTAYEFLPLQVTGVQSKYLPQSGVLIVNETEVYDLLEGPVVRQTERAAVEVEIVNDTDASTQVLPTVQIFAGTFETNVPVYEQPFAPVTIAVDESYVGEYTLPISSIEPGVYTAVVRFETTNGASVISPLEIRFIVDGLKPKLKQVQYGSTDLTQTDDQFTVHVTYADVPANLRKNEDGTFQDARTAALFATSSSASQTGNELDALLPSGMGVIVRMFDSSTNELIAQKQQRFSTDSPSVEVLFDDVTDVYQVTIEVTLQQDEETIDTFTDTVFLTTNQKHNIIAAMWNAYPLHIISGFILLVLLAVVVMYVRHTKKKSVTQPIIRG